MSICAMQGNFSNPTHSKNCCDTTTALILFTLREPIQKIQ